MSWSGPLHDKQLGWHYSQALFSLCWYVPGRQCSTHVFSNKNLPYLQIVHWFSAGPLQSAHKSWHASQLFVSVFTKVPDKHLTTTTGSYTFGVSYSPSSPSTSFKKSVSSSRTTSPSYLNIAKFELIKSNTLSKIIILVIFIL